MISKLELIVKKSQEINKLEQEIKEKEQKIYRVKNQGQILISGISDQIKNLKTGLHKIDNYYVYVRTAGKTIFIEAIFFKNEIVYECKDFDTIPF